MIQNENSKNYKEPSMILDRKSPLHGQGYPWANYRYGSIPAIPNSHVYVYIEDGYIVQAGLMLKRIDPFRGDPYFEDVAYWKEDQETYWHFPHNQLELL